MFFKTLKCATGVVGSILKKETPECSDFFESLYSLKKDPWNYENSEYEKEKYRRTLEILCDIPFETVLEAGCSEGVFTRMMSCICKTMTAADISQTAIDRAKEKNSDRCNIEFIQMDIEKEELSGKWDLIVCSEVLYYMDKPERIAAVRDKFISALNPGGHILLVHMRRLSDDDSGHPAPITGYPSLGAKTVHGVFRESQKLKAIREDVQDMYVISLFGKG
ncbi:MAG: nodulation S family protein [Firmicutes bacterium]|nr:nodulation S family protein [Bacillota bacterium]